MHVRDYVEATYEVLKEKEVKPTLDALRASLTKRGLLSIYPRILRGLHELLRRKEKTDRPTLRLARKEDAARHKDAIAAALREIGNEHHDIALSPEIIGGFIVEGRGKRIDGSYKGKLLQAYRRITAE